MDNGTIKFNDVVITLTAQATMDNYKDGVAYYAKGTDSDGNQYNIRWDVINSCDDESNACDWDNPVEIVKI